jgi:hypothetical protein
MIQIQRQIKIAGSRYKRVFKICNVCYGRIRTSGLRIWIMLFSTVASRSFLPITYLRYITSIFKNNKLLKHKTVKIKVVSFLLVD